jgi:glutathione S-transferase
MATEIILHHYDISPFSEKARVMLGVKGAAWRSVIQPVIMPKPHLIPLTGGYRRIPVLQIGADIYCDSQVILAELEHRFPDPPVVRGMDWSLNMFADRQWFQATMVPIFAEMGDAVPADFIADREKLSGGRPFDVNALKAGAPWMEKQWRAYAAWLEEGLTEPFLGGARPALADIAAWMNIWWMSSAATHTADRLLTGFDRVLAWRDRIRAIGHGQRTEMSMEDAISVALKAAPSGDIRHDANDPAGLQPGAAVVVQADDYGRDPVEGVLVALRPDRVTVACEDAEVGAIHVHFPRAGYVLAGR